MPSAADLCFPTEGLAVGLCWQPGSLRPLGLERSARSFRPGEVELLAGDPGLGSSRLPSVQSSRPRCCKAAPWVGPSPALDRGGPCCPASSCWSPPRRERFRGEVSEAWSSGGVWAQRGWGWGWGCAISPKWLFWAHSCSAPTPLPPGSQK